MEQNDLILKQLMDLNSRMGQVQSSQESMRNEVANAVGGLRNELKNHMDHEEIELSEIKAHVQKTNGRVTTLEANENKRKGIMWILGGAWTAVVLIGSAFITRGH